jgi:hypothetical protein
MGVILRERHIEAASLTLCEFLMAAEWIAKYAPYVPRANRPSFRDYDHALCSYGTQGFALIYTPTYTFLFDPHGFERPGPRYGTITVPP